MNEWVWNKWIDRKMNGYRQMNHEWMNEGKDK